MDDEKIEIHIENPEADCTCREPLGRYSRSRWLISMGVAVVSFVGVSLFGINEFSNRTEAAVQEQGDALQEPISEMKEDGEAAIARLEGLEALSELDPALIQELVENLPQIVAYLESIDTTIQQATSTTSSPRVTTPLPPTTPTTPSG